MSPFTTLLYEATGAIARIELNRPDSGNALTLVTPGELAAAIERANLDPAVHVIALSGRGPGFCSGYDLTLLNAAAAGSLETPPGSPLDPAVQRANHDPEQPWDPTIDFAMMMRNVRGFMSVFHSEKPVVCKVHGFCLGGGTDLALCADLLLVEDAAKIGYPPSRVWGVPTTAFWVARIGAEKAKRLLFTGDCLNGTEAAAWGLALEAAPIAELNDKFERLLDRIARLPVNQLVMIKLLINQSVAAQGLYGSQLLGTIFDGISRHTKEGYAFQRRVAEAGVKQAVRERDQPFGDAGRSTFRG